MLKSEDILFSAGFSCFLYILQCSGCYWVATFFGSGCVANNNMQVKSRIYKKKAATRSEIVREKGTKMAQIAHKNIANIAR